MEASRVSESTWYSAVKEALHDPEGSAFIANAIGCPNTAKAVYYEMKTYDLQGEIHRALMELNTTPGIMSPFLENLMLESNALNAMLHEVIAAYRNRGKS